ncbi:hypothetical protein ACFL4T_07965 [candidate division KSB1 bacterium]
MEEPKENFADESDVLSFLEKLGVELSPEAKAELKKRIEEEPIDKTTLRRSKYMAKNKVFESLLDLTLTERAKRIENSPVFQAVKEARDKFISNKVKKIAHEIVSEKRLNEIFYDERRWERFYPDILNIDDDGSIVKIQDGSTSPYIGFLRNQIIKGKPALTLLTTKRERLWEGIENAKYWKLKDSPDTSNLEKSFLEFINSKLKKLK